MQFKSELVTAASGSIGGVTYSRGNGTLRREKRHVRVRSSSSHAATRRASLTEAAHAWSSQLTQAERNGWNDYAQTLPHTNALGDATKLSGRSAFVRSATTRTAIGLSIISAPPTKPGFATLKIEATGAVQAANVIFVVWSLLDDWTTTTSGGLLVRTSRFVPSSRSPKRTGLRELFVTTGGAPAVPPFRNLTVTGFGQFPSTIPVGFIYALEAVAVDQFGRTSPIIQTQGLVS